MEEHWSHRPSSADEMNLMVQQEMSNLKALKRLSIGAQGIVADPDLPGVDLETHDEWKANSNSGDGDPASNAMLRRQVSMTRSRPSLHRQTPLNRQTSLDRQRSLHRQVPLNRQSSLDQQRSLDRQNSLDRLSNDTSHSDHQLQSWSDSAGETEVSSEAEEPSAVPNLSLRKGRSRKFLSPATNEIPIVDTPTVSPSNTDTTEKCTADDQLDSDLGNGLENIWVPAGVHPELAPNEWQAFVDEKLAAIRNSQEAQHLSRLQRHSSRLSHVVAAPEEYVDAAAILDRRRRISSGDRRKSIMELSKEFEPGTRESNANENMILGRSRSSTSPRYGSESSLGGPGATFLRRVRSSKAATTDADTGATGLRRSTHRLHKPDFRKREPGLRSKTEPQSASSNYSEMDMQRMSADFKVFPSSTDSPNNSSNNSGSSSHSGVSHYASRSHVPLSERGRTSRPKPPLTVSISKAMATTAEQPPSPSAVTPSPNASNMLGYRRKMLASKRPNYHNESNPVEKPKLEPALELKSRGEASEVPSELESSPFASTTVAANSASSSVKTSTVAPNDFISTHRDDELHRRQEEYAKTYYSLEGKLPPQSNMTAGPGLVSKKSSSVSLSDTSGAPTQPRNSNLDSVVGKSQNSEPVTSPPHTPMSENLNNSAVDKILKTPSPTDIAVDDTRQAISDESLKFSEGPRSSGSGETLVQEALGDESKEGKRWKWLDKENYKSDPKFRAEPKAPARSPTENKDKSSKKGFSKLFKKRDNKKQDFPKSDVKDLVTSPTSAKSPKTLPGKQTSSFEEIVAAAAEKANQKINTSSQEPANTSNRTSLERSADIDSRASPHGASDPVSRDKKQRIAARRGHSRNASRVVNNAFEDKSTDDNMTHSEADNDNGSPKSHTSSPNHPEIKLPYDIPAHQVSDRASVMMHHRFPLHIERAIYRLSHMKLANPRQPLRQQVLLSNFMYAYLNLINFSYQQQQLAEFAEQNQSQSQMGSLEELQIEQLKRIENMDYERDGIYGGHDNEMSSSSSSSSDEDTEMETWHSDGPMADGTSLDDETTMPIY